MRGRWLAVALTVAACHAEPSERSEHAAPHDAIRVDHIRLGAPDYGGIDTRAAWLTLADYLHHRLDLPVDVVVAEPYHELPALLKEHKVDIAQVPPLVYATLREEDGRYEPLVTQVISGSSTYLGHLYVGESSPYQTIADLKGARIGYVDRSSSSGYLFERELIRSRGLDPDTLFSSAQFFKSHAAVLDALHEGKIDVAAAIDVTSGWAGAGVLERPPGIRVVAKTERIPNDCMVARPEFDRGAVEAVKGALLSLHVGDPDERRILAALRVNGWVKADEARYERTRAVLDREGQATGRR